MNLLIQIKFRKKLVIFQFFSLIKMNLQFCIKNDCTLVFVNYMFILSKTIFFLLINYVYFYNDKDYN